MEKIFTLNSVISSTDLQDAIDERITKARAITACLLAADEVNLTYEIVRETVWTIGDLLGELELLCERLSLS